MKFLVGVLHTIENEYEECLSCIYSQEGVEVEVFKIHNKPKKKAHDILYSTFMDKSDAVDFFVKVDADMVINDPLLFNKVAGYFTENPNFKHVTLRVYDFFTGQHITGMHFYSNVVRWRRKADEIVFTDDAPVNVSESEIITLQDKNLVTHCANPSAFQSFHFGLHKGIKVVHGLIYKEEDRQHQGEFHLNNIHSMLGAYVKSGDQRMLWAFYAAVMTLDGHFKKEHISYTNPFAQKVFNLIIKQKKNSTLLTDGVAKLLCFYLKYPRYFIFYAKFKARPLYRFLKKSLGQKTGTKKKLSS